ncbi:MAG TPA: polyribonucleotide nucleotidyltransferase [Smithella sp.]|jgi:polyribonucleotide nucleotidyltransferase|nr:polyribonucleotide nucleotidyltransferase [Smithella sp.]NMC97365.1 polyribonucleotide nucleotidyltransferase [Deltaproteobacteria bacterium]OQC53994.1 MAG: Polyribonucleotide nucleotidyltransferase [Deltaproteobacteria bacterium ADurb.Bin022]HOE32021.1 polyribonucleotide nucleotidyltransferase [Smithella sp.]HOG10458.1 polyribonucleotide nucleotidyltransferase [Smithella sp.]
MSNVFSADFAGRNISLKANYVAAQADGAVLVYYGDTVVLVTAVSLKSTREGVDFLPLTVDYQEMTFAAGKIPGGFFKREGRPNEREILTSRVIDRAIRPLFPKGYFSETQLVATLLSVDKENDPDVASLIGASAALGISDIPFKGPIAGVRVGRINGEFVANMCPEKMKESEMSLFLVGRKVTPGTSGRPYDVELVMMEGEAKEVPEDIIVDAIKFGLESIRPVIDLQDQIQASIGKVKRPVEEPVPDEELVARVREEALPGLKEGYAMPRKLERYSKLGDVRAEVIKNIGGDDAVLSKKVAGIIENLESRILRDMIIQDKKRIDGRSSVDIRPISSEAGVLPRAHGSALFSRGETQALAALTLGTSADEQRMDYVGGEEIRTFLLHYNFPPFSVGEAKMLRSPGRREIGHGALARKALVPVLPSPEEFPYTIRIVSEILSSNGSSSMATVCGGILCLMDGGVPVKDIVAGIAMGLLKEGNEIVILSDILGDEDHAGDMDFKVCGTEKGVTAMQMDIKIDGLTEDILRKALAQAREGRMHIIGKIRETLAAPRGDISQYAPRITTVKVKEDQVRTVIGSGGKNIRQIISETGVTIDVEDDGTVTIASADAEAAARAVAMVKWLTEEAEIGKIYRGTVKKIVDFGAFVEILPGTEGLLHISQIAKERIAKVTDVLQEGDEVMVKVLEIDKSGKIRLSRKEALGAEVK